MTVRVFAPSAFGGRSATPVLRGDGVYLRPEDLSCVSLKCRAIPL